MLFDVRVNVIVRLGMVRGRQLKITTNALIKMECPLFLLLKFPLDVY